ncbi:MAG: hypothetical protein MK135_02670 [Polyangiaceae bacterium]|nr:hypothetical protein [Polyangiaceae bacterium]
MSFSSKSAGLFLAGSLGATLLLGCESLPQFSESGGSRVTAGPNGSGGLSSEGGTGLENLTEGGGSGEENTSGPCADFFCPQDKRCDVVEGEAKCVGNICAELNCSAKQECIETEEGAFCSSLACSTDLDCAPERYCDDAEGICLDDQCTPGVRSCSPTGDTEASGGVQVFLCATNGSGFAVEASCESAGSFESLCVSGGGGAAGCSCEDDWDCPGFQECEAGTCSGSLEPATCRLPPADITSVLPSQEIVWGTAPAGLADGRLRVVDGQDVPLTGQETGAADEPGATALSPWSGFAQVTQTPIVANLDDDNGDSVIDERDSPEILFLTFRNGYENDDGVLRVVHGGGVDADGRSKKGRDYLALCGGNRFFSGDPDGAGPFFDVSGAELASEPTCGSTAAGLDPAGTIAVGDLNYDGFPEIVVYGENTGDGVEDTFDERAGRIYIYDHQGRQLFRSQNYSFANVDSSGENPGISLANVVPALSPANEMVEIVIGRDLFRLEIDGSGDWSVAQRLSGNQRIGLNAQGPFSCVADLIAERPGMEIVAGGSVYGIPLVMDQLDTSSQLLVNLGDAGRDGFCAIADVWGANNAQAPGPANPLDREPELVLISGGELFVYDLAISEPALPATGWVTFSELTATNGISRVLPYRNTNNGGGAPNIDDFDGDGFPEIGSAGEAGYVVFDLQLPTANGGVCPEWSSFNDPQVGTTERSPPAGSCSSDADCNQSADSSTWNFACNTTANVGAGACVCLHNSWRRLTQDASSRVTGSSVFDFNGDGAAEVIYNDECHFRMYGGLDGTELFLEESEGRTRTEYPIVADVDNDGNAEIVFATTTESGFCNRTNASSTASAPCSSNAECPSYNAPNGQRCIDNFCKVADPGVFNAGIEVWGDPSDQWVSARRIWNQYSYHVTNVREDGGIPRVEPNSWEPLGQRLYNTYRSQPRALGSAPDLIVNGLQVIAPGSCGGSTNLLIGAEVRNQGDLRAAGIPVRFEGTWDDENQTEELLDPQGEPLSVVITQSLEPGAAAVFQVEYEADSNSPPGFPDTIRVIVDPDSSGSGVVRECQEENNEASAAVEGAEPLPDLRVILQDPTTACPPPVRGTVFNAGAKDAADVVVQIYAGDPAGGGRAIGEIEVGSVAAGDSVTFDNSQSNLLIPTRSPVLLYGEVDAQDQVEECNENNNLHATTRPTSCRQVN